MILDAAIDNFGEVGFEHTKWATIADEVGIGQTALYHYFESKTHCLLTIMSDRARRALERTAGGTAGIEDPAREAPAAVVSAFDVTPREALQARILLSHQDLLVAPRAVRARGGRAPVRSASSCARSSRSGPSCCRDGMDGRRFQRRDEQVLVRLLLGALNSVWRWYRPKGPRTLDEISELVVEASVRLVH